MKPSATKIRFCVLLLLLISCKKHDYCDGPPKSESCDLMQSLVYMLGEPDPETGEESPATFSQYRKEYDGNGQVSKVVAGLYTLRLYDSVTLLLRYNGSTVSFVDAAQPGDTLTTATFDAQHRLVKMTNGNVAEDDNPFSTTEFYYGGSRLSGFKIVYTGGITHLSYDANGNIVRMYRDEDSAYAGTFFTYDLSVAAKRQFYSDHFVNGGENALYLAQFLGWLPDLEPLNQRTYWKIVFNDDNPADDIPPYVFLEGYEDSHVYDGDGNLVSYNGSYTNIWSCAAKNDILN